MPRPPRRPPEGPDPEAASTKAPAHARAERRAWLSQLKEDAFSNSHHPHPLPFEPGCVRMSTTPSAITG